MTAEQFRLWRHTLGWTQAQAATRLGKSRASVIRYGSGDWPVPLTVELACMALTCKALEAEK